MERTEGRQGEPRNGVANLHGGRRAGDTDGEEFRKNAPQEAGERKREPGWKPDETLTGKRTGKGWTERKERGRIFCLQTDGGVTKA
jgi:hypothetical protein